MDSPEFDNLSDEEKLQVAAWNIIEKFNSNWQLIGDLAIKLINKATDELKFSRSPYKDTLNEKRPN